jgi:hypothetical protein
VAIPRQRTQRNQYLFDSKTTENKIKASTRGFVWPLFRLLTLIGRRASSAIDLFHDVEGSDQTIRAMTYAAVANIDPPINRHAIPAIFSGKSENGANKAAPSGL